MILQTVTMTAPPELIEDKDPEKLDVDTLAYRAALRWVELMPDLELPEHSALVHCAICAGTAGIVLRAIERCAKKTRQMQRFGEEEMASSEAFGYVLNVCKLESSGVRTVRPRENRNGVGIRRLG
jgi:hypothetical protein